MSETSSKPPAGPTGLTYRDFLQLPDDGKRYEILEGELVVTPTPITRHQRFSKRLQWELMNQLELMGKGEVFDAPLALVLDDYNVLVPDLMYVSRERSEIIGEHYLSAAPDLVVEILSPSTASRDRLQKAALYARFGVRNYWIVDGDASRLEAFALEGSQYRPALSAAAPEVVGTSDPELRLDLAEIFR